MNAFKSTETAEAATGFPEQGSEEHGSRQQLAVSAQFADFYSTHRIQARSPRVRGHLTLLLNQDGIEPEQLVWAALDQLQLPWFAELLADASRRDMASLAKKLRDDEYLKQLDENLLHALLRRTINTDLPLEQLIILLRRLLLQWAEENAHGLDATCLRLMVSIATQCFNNEYIYATTSKEDETVERLRARLGQQLEQSQVLADLSLLTAYAMYASLRTLNADEGLMHLQGNCEAQSIRELIVRQVQEPLEEEQLREVIPSIGLSEDSTSNAVRRQYEESPYPRWFTIQLPTPQSFAHAMAERFPFLEKLEPRNPLRILIAGCGTGWHPIHVAAQYDKAEVYALDLSKASLAYALRQARGCGVSNMKFYHGDILCLNRLGVKFDLIEAIGVVHHMADPAAGIRALADQLNPGGFIKLGIYNRRARRHLASAQDFVAERNLRSSPSALRALRQEMLEHQVTIDSFSKRFDFFYQSGFRDLLCHVREVQFSPAEVGLLLSQIGLELLGVRGIDKEKRQAYTKQFPQDPGMRDLALVEAYEAEHPDLFSSLMMFWVRKVR
jgi:SAM-dependent methyltransferase